MSFRRFAVCLVLTASVAGSVVAGEPATLARIEPGTRIDVKALPKRTHVVFRSRPKLVAGDIEKIRESIRKALETYTTVVIVETEPDPAQAGKFRRGAYAIGVGVPDENGDLIVTKATAKGQGLKLGFFDNRVLAERDKELNTVVSPAATPTMAVFDFSAMHLRDGRRFPIVLRYFSLVDVDTGKLATVHCVFESTADGLRLLDDQLLLLAPNHVMDWPLHVDATKSTLGAPGPDAFSVTKLPHGTPLDVPADVRTAAAARIFDADSAAAVEKNLREALATHRRPSG